MDKRLIATILTVSCATTALIGVMPITKANAQEKNEVSTMVNEDETLDIIKEIENKYLTQNEDGTFSISDLAYNEFDKDVIDFIKEGSNEINSYIKANVLEFKVQNDEIVNTYANLENVANEKGMRDYGNILSSYTYCSNYQWFWWGYKTNVNVTGAKLLRNTLMKDMAQFGGLCGIATALNPAAGVIVAIAGAIGGITFSDGIYHCANGIDSGRGVQATGWGKPATGLLMGIKAR